MRRCILSFALLCGLTTVRAQGIDIGVKVGLSSTQIDHFLNSKSRTGFLGGLFVALKTSDSFAIQPELLFAQSGDKSDLRKIRTDRLSVPIMLKYRIFPAINLIAGPIFNFKLGKKTDLGKGYAAMRDQIAHKEFVLDAGFGLVLNLPLGFHGDLRYTLGLSSALENKGDKSLGFSARDCKSKGWQITVGYSFL